MTLLRHTPFNTPNTPPQMLAPLLDSKGANAMVRARYGYMVYNRHDQFIGNSIAHYGEYCQQEVHLLKQLLYKGDTVVEVGANIGAHTLALANILGAAGTLHAFEPQAAIFQTLSANMALNSITHVACHNVAVGAHAGTRRMPYVDYAQAGDFGSVKVQENDSEGVPVSMVALDDSVRVGALRLIKVDAEGMELAVLKGAAKLIERFRPYVYVDNDRPEHSGALIEYLWGLGYECYWHFSPLYNYRNFAGNAMNIFAHIAACNMLCLPKHHGLDLEGFEKITDASRHPLVDGNADKGE